MLGCGRRGMATSLPIHLLQKNSVGALPKARIAASISPSPSITSMLRNAWKVVYLLSSIPNGARNMPRMPTKSIAAISGRR